MGHLEEGVTSKSTTSKMGDFDQSYRLFCLFCTKNKILLILYDFRVLKLQFKGLSTVHVTISIGLRRLFLEMYSFLEKFFSNASKGITVKDRIRLKLLQRHFNDEKLSFVCNSRNFVEY